MNKSIELVARVQILYERHIPPPTLPLGEPWREVRLERWETADADDAYGIDAHYLIIEEQHVDGVGETHRKAWMPAKMNHTWQYIELARNAALDILRRQNASAPESRTP